jgi:hypothetical protein
MPPVGYTDGGLIATVRRARTGRSRTGCGAGEGFLTPKQAPGLCRGSDREPPTASHWQCGNGGTSDKAGSGAGGKGSDKDK